MRKSPVTHSHAPARIRARLAEEPRQSYLRDWVYGGIDGSVTTFAIVSGVVGAQLSPQVVVVLGAANLIADGFSMAASNYLGTRAEQSEMKELRRIEEEHIRLYPDGEKEEVRQIFAAKGLKGEALDGIVSAITEDRERWIATMLSEEYNLPRLIRSPKLAALSTFAAFLLCGFVPLAAYLFRLPNAFETASLLTAAVFFMIGSLKSLWTRALWWTSGLETLLIGGSAAGLAFGVGVLLRQFSSAA